MDESEAEGPAPSSHRASSASGRSDFESSMTEMDSASEVSDAPKKTKKSTSKATRPSLKKGGSSEKGKPGGSTSFLTAAEQAALEKKSDKKEKEDPFEFLKDVRDVSHIQRFCISAMILNYSSFWLNRKTNIDQGSQTMTHEPYMYLRVHGRPSPHLRNRYVHTPS